LADDAVLLVRCQTTTLYVHAEKPVTLRWLDSDGAGWPSGSPLRATTANEKLTLTVDSAFPIDVEG